MTPVKRRRRSFNVLAAVDAVREAYPELNAPLTITALRRVLLLAEIDVVRRPIRAYSYVEGALGSFVIVLRSGLNPRHERRVLAHEYAHIKLHHSDSGEVEFQRSPCRRGDPRELEAQFFVRLLELGPMATPDHSEIARFVSALDAPALIPKIAAQLKLDIADVPAPVRKPAARSSDPTFSELFTAALDESVAHGEQVRRRRGLPAVLHPPERPRRNADFERLSYDEKMKTSRYVSPDDRRWWIFNYSATITNGKRTWIRVRDFMSPTITHRLFTNAAGERRVYVFANRREKRDHRVQHLDRQIAQARLLPVRRKVVAPTRVAK